MRMVRSFGGSMDYWQECAMYRQHAVDCGVDLTGAVTVPCDSRAAGCIIKVPPLHPETMDELVPEGFSLTAEQCETLRNECGIDYLIVQAV
jgi:hypothetical protein